MKKVIITVCVVLILLIALVPIPQKVTRTYHAVNTLNGESAEITLDMMYLRFLFLKDRLNGEIAVTSASRTTVYGEHMYYAGMFPSNHEDVLIHWLTGWHMNEEKSTAGDNIVGSEQAIAYISRDFNHIVLQHNPRKDASDPQPREYVGTMEADSLSRTLTLFDGFVKNPEAIE